MGNYFTQGSLTAIPNSAINYNLYIFRRLAHRNDNSDIADPARARRHAAKLYFVLTKILYSLDNCLMNIYTK